MRSLVYLVAATVDGYIAGADRGDPDLFPFEGPRLKAEQGKDIWLAGGGRLAASVVDEIDELVLKVNPVVLGAGTPLFGALVGPRPVNLTGHKAYPNGFALMRWRWSP
jgi:dihydrofolate reductase